MPNLKTIPVAKLPDIIRLSEQAGDNWHTPLYRAAMAGHLSLLWVPPGERAPASMLDPVKHRKPLVVVLAGDPGDPAIHCGPEAYPQATRFLRWARFVMLHGAGGEPFHYLLAVQAAAATGRALVVETDGATLPAWAACKARLAPLTAGLEVRPKPGDQHPLAGIPAGMVMQ